MVSFGEPPLERDYTYCRVLASRLRDTATAERLDLGLEVKLSHLKTEVTYEGKLEAGGDGGEVKPISGEGARDGQRDWSASRRSWPT